MPSGGDNDFEHDVREDDRPKPQTATIAKRPVTERWWWFAIVSAQFWFRLVLWPFQDRHSRADSVFAVIGLGLLIVGTPLWIWGRRQGERKRAANQQS